jgi:LuxR family maltose regulon positive regulatory protein
VLDDWLDAAWARAASFSAAALRGPSALTTAELRVLRLLPTHLSFREIAGRLHVSANTIKTQAHAVYRKLDASSRTEAVAHARDVGLLDGA